MPEGRRAAKPVVGVDISKHWLDARLSGQAGVEPVLGDVDPDDRLGSHARLRHARGGGWSARRIACGREALSAVRVSYGIRVIGSADRE